MNEDKKQKILKIIEEVEKNKTTGSFTGNHSQGGITQIEKREIVK